MNESTDLALREQVRAARYAQAAIAVRGGAVSEQVRAVESECCSTTCCTPANVEGDGWSGAGLYERGVTDGLPDEAVAASLGCGNPLMVADLREGERVLDLGSGGGIDVLLSATGRSDRLRVRRRHDRGDARPGPRQRSQGRCRQCRVPPRRHRSGPAARRGGRCRDLQLRDQPVDGQARSARRDVPGPRTWRADRHLRRRRRGHPHARGAGPVGFLREPSPEPCHGPSTWTGSRPRDSWTPRSPSRTRRHPRCMRRSSGPPSRSDLADEIRFIGVIRHGR